MARDARWDVFDVLVIAGACCLWVIGVLLFLGAAGHSAESAGLLLTIIAATTTVLVTLRAWQLRMHRAFVHGYHAGWHDGTGRRQDERAKDCDVLDYAEIRAKRLSRLG